MKLLHNCPNPEESSVLLGVIKQCCEIGKATITFDEMLTELEALELRVHTKEKKAPQYKVFNAPQQKVRQCAAR